MTVAVSSLKFLIWAVAVLVLVSGKRQKREYSVLSWNDCGGPDKVLHIESLSISPMPVILPGVMRITSSAHSSATISAASLELTIKRSTFLGYITVPCISNVGSCTYDDMCTLVDTMERENWAGISRQVSNQIRGFLQSAGISSTCPVPPSEINVTEYPFQMPELPSILNFLADGNYRVNFRIRDRSSHRVLGCFNVNMSLKKEETRGWFFFRRR
ncbi:ganglioside GM2 activator-like [Liolophura sinensis]|uniref:ganglioside GM2 activator-like n=1 Tax=Liolophura sinensis TaxID=3198878 RepID=UPI0031589C5C